MMFAFVQFVVYTFLGFYLKRFTIWLYAWNFRDAVVQAAVKSDHEFILQTGHWEKNSMDRACQDWILVNVNLFGYRQICCGILNDIIEIKKSSPSLSRVNVWLVKSLEGFIQAKHGINNAGYHNIAMTI